jgi:hypothetical protein
LSNVKEDLISLDMKLFQTGVTGHPVLLLKLGRKSEVRMKKYI